jgi:hypothetical protein
MAGSVNTAAQRPQSVNITGINNTAGNNTRVQHLRVGLMNNTGGGSYAPAVAFLSRSADKPQITLI